MRRSRHKLQVSTFPFLAVLLCAMGSLILFLLVMDRRAKIVARNKTHEAIAARTEEQLKHEAAVKEEFEAQRQKLHQALQSEQAETQKQSVAIHTKLVGAEERLSSEHMRFQELQQAAAREEMLLKKSQELVQNGQTSLDVVEKQAAATKAERDRLTKDVRELEQVVEALKALKKRDQHTFSVVPYRGKHGDNRIPIYVECGKNGLVFHPEHKALDGDDFTVLSLRGEVERRAGGLAREKKSDKDDAPETAKNPYVLFLIRPEGINSYYKAQAALRGYRIDFGYEVVDQHWVLDFASENVAGGAQWTPPTKQIASAPLLAAAPNPPAGVSPLVPASGSSARAVPFGAGASGNGPLSGGNLSVSREPTGANLAPGAGGTGNGTSDIPAGTALSDSGPRGVGNSGVPGLPLSANPPVGGVEMPSPGASSSPIGLAVGPSKFVPVGRTPGVLSGGQAKGGLGAAGDPVGSGARVIASTGTAPGPSGFEVRRIEEGPGQSSTTPRPTGTPGGSGTQGGTGTSTAAPSQGTGAAGGSASQGGSGTPGVPIPGSGGAKSVGGASDPQPEGMAMEEDGGPPRKKMPALGTAGQNSKQPAPALGNLIGNRDFVITLVCFGDHLTIYPGGKQHRWKGTDLAATDQAIVQYVRDLIERRQASVRAGEPPYRPLLRFQLAADGLRPYLHIYPQLEFLRVPMTREALED